MGLLELFKVLRFEIREAAATSFGEHAPSLSHLHAPVFTTALYIAEGQSMLPTTKVFLPSATADGYAIPRLPLPSKRETARRGKLSDTC